MTQVNPYLNFNGNCREAMTFYHECLGGELNMQTIGGSPIEAQCPAGMQNQILHSALVKDELVIMGSDMVGPDVFTPGNNISLSVSCGSDEEINEYYLKLSADGRIIDPLREQFFGAKFAVLTDKFGIRWMLIYDDSLNQN